MALRKDVEKKVKLQEFYRSVEQLLTPGDKDYLFYSLKEYNTYKSVAKLMLALNSCLDTPEKMDLLPFIRDLIPKHDQKKFDSLAPYNRMAHPPKVSSSQEESVSSNSTRVKTIRLVRSQGTPLGFTIRGGREHNLGIYISHVDSLSLAERYGLQVGDQIFNVNGISFDSITHSSAVLVLKSHDDLRITVRSAGRIPGHKLSKDVFVWVDASGNPIKEPEDRTEPAKTVDERAAGDRLLASPDRHKVVLHADRKRPFGFSIRGGSEYHLGIYISSVDKGSLAEEHGLKVGDQILDVNRHSFLSILHQEAVTIFRSYPTLIMTIKSLGKLPKLAASLENKDKKEEREGRRAPDLQPDKKTSETSSHSPPSSPTARQRASNLLKSFASPLSPTKRSLLPNEKSFHHSDLVINSSSASRRTKEAAAHVRRSKSFNDPAMRSMSIAGSSETLGYNPLDMAITGAPPLRTRALSAGSFSSLPRPSKQKKAVGKSPLATHESRATSASPNIGQAHMATNALPSQGQHTADSSQQFFEHGVGSQIMLASSGSQAKQMLMDRARRTLGHSEVEALQEKFKQYEESRKVTELVEFLIDILDTPEKITLLTEIRSVLHPSDLVKFDLQVSPHEVEALHWRASEHEDMEGPDEEVANQYNKVLTAIQNHGGQRVLRRSRDESNKPRPPNLGAFGNSTAQSLVTKATSTEPDLVGMQTRESFLAWNDERPWEQAPIFQPQPLNNAVIVEVPKSAPSIGLTIEGGVDTPTPGIIITKVREGGAAEKDGFLQPGFEIVEVDGVRLRGKTHDEAAMLLAQAFNSENPTIELIVIPN